MQLQEHWALRPLLELEETHTSLTKRDGRAVGRSQPASSPCPVGGAAQMWLALLNMSRRGSAGGSALPCSSAAIKGCSSCCSTPSGLLSLSDLPLLETWLGNWKQEICSGIAWLADWGCSSSTGQANRLCCGPVSMPGGEAMLSREEMLWFHAFCISTGTILVVSEET